MKTTISLITVFILITTAVMAQQPVTDMSLRFQGFIPRDQLDWDSGSAIELQMRFWAEEDIATVFSMGLGSWTAVSEFSEETDANGTLAMSIYGNVSTLPVGLSVLFRNRISDRLAMNMEAGVKYVFTESNINVEMVLDDGVESTYLKDIVSIEDSFLAVVGVSMEAYLADGMTMEFGVGYQMDLVTPHEQFLGEDAGETSMQGASVHFGITWAY